MFNNFVFSQNLRSFSIYKYGKNNSVSVSDITYSNTLVTTNAVKDLFISECYT